MREFRAARFPTRPTLVVFGAQMAGVIEWLRHFAVPSVAAILGDLRRAALTQRRALDANVSAIEEMPSLTFGGKLGRSESRRQRSCLSRTAFGPATRVARPLSRSSCDGPPCWSPRGQFAPLPILKDVSWSVLPLSRVCSFLVEG